MWIVSKTDEITTKFLNDIEFLGLVIIIQSIRLPI